MDWIIKDVKSGLFFSDLSARALTLSADRAQAMKFIDAKAGLQAIKTLQWHFPSFAWCTTAQVQP